ncbi:MAG TPA: hypothetical protein ENK43_05910 [Planctomycetes bacterium]|nr:hypothetical protein [Planctomycetota bacterium]
MTRGLMLPRAGSVLFTVLLFGLSTMGQQVATRWTATGSTIDFGVIAADAGDVNGDGIPDVIFGEPAAGTSVPGTLSFQGVARVLSGKDGSLIHQWTGMPAQGLGKSVDGVGDVNGDGFDDVIVGSVGGVVGAPFPSTTGQATVFSGFDGSVLYALQTPNQSPSMNAFGAAVAGVGDVDLDGTPDFAVGDILAATGGSLSGEVYVYSGISGVLLFSHAGVMPDLRFGAAIAPAGDVNGDGFGDVLVGNDVVIPFMAPPTASGVVKVFSGFDGSTLHTFTSPTAGVPYGRTVAGAGDLNQDGFGDVLFTVLGFPSAATATVEAHSGFDGSLLFSIAVPSNGLRLDGGRDVNGDGVNDLAVDYLLYSGQGTATPLASFNGVVHLADDVDGDGFSEFLAVSVNPVSFLGTAELKSLGGAVPYGVAAAPANVLDLAFVPGAGPQGAAAGFGLVTGAGAGSQGGALLSVAPAMMSVGGVLLLVDATPGAFLVFPATYDLQGQLVFSLDLRQPLLAGQMFYLQFFEANATAPQGVFASNGLALLFVP